jgi:Cof subfamily protein (haloacid dehalogenase superfamily)
LYKLVVLDVDDTIVTQQNAISAATKDAVLSVRDIGVPVTLASGRMYETMRRLAGELRIDLPLICCNGALIKDEETTVCRETLTNTAAEAVLDFFRQKGKTLQLYREEGLYSKKKCERTWQMEEKAGLSCRIIDEQSYNSFNRDLLKMLVRLDPVSVREYQQELAEKFSGVVTAAISHSVYLEITNYGVDKAKALIKLAGLLGVRREEVLAVGDSPNDQNMLCWAGLGVAMGNASAEVKRQADVVAPSVWEDGVAHVLTKYVLEGTGR